MYFGKIKNTEDDWGFDVFTESFESYKSINPDIHMKIIKNANIEGKVIKGDKDGNPILVDPPPLTEEECNQQRLIELEMYLQKTDWYAIRFADTGTPVPEEIKTKRQQAREEISTLRETLNSN